MELNSNQKAVLATILYSDIFNFPLTEEEIWSDLIAREKMDKNTLKKTAASLSKIIAYENGFYCLTGKEKTIQQRKKRNNITRKKLALAQSIARDLSYIPTVLFIGLTGRLAHNDADKNDDIDMFFITQKNTIWATRLLILAVLELRNLRRKSNDQNPQDKVCPNLLIDETALVWPKEKHDLYTAHEIVHVYPLFERNNIYQQFLQSNQWVKKFYPNKENTLPEGEKRGEPKKYRTIKTISHIITHPLMEKISERFQKLYMKKKLTKETILPNFLAFHPYDYRQKVLRLYNTKMKNYRSLTKE